MSITKFGLRPICMALLLLPVVAHAQRVEFEGHTYELIIAPDITWAAANAAAQATMLGNVNGHLATITSAGENAFLYALIAPPTLASFPGKSEAWIGGFQVPGSAEPSGGWTWVNSEGSFPGSGMIDMPPVYSNWQAGEPNNVGNGEDHLTLGRFDGVAGAGGGVAGAWNDSNESNGHIGGYIIEWDNVVPAEECQEPGGCNPSGVQNVEIPASVVLEEGDTLTQFVLGPFADPRVDQGTGECADRRELDVFSEFPGIPGGVPGALIIPDFLCGSYEFALIRSDATFEVLQDVVRSEQFPEDFFAVFFDCAGALNDAELQRRGVFAWQPDDRFDVVEQRTLELTNGCGSSRGATKGLSWFVINLHIDCGIPFDTDPAAVLQCFQDLVSDKFSALEQALKNAKKSINSPSYGALRSTLVNARNRFKQGKYDQSLSNLASFIALVEGGDFVLGGNNDQGELLMRAENIAFTIDEKIDP